MSHASKLWIVFLLASPFSVLVPVCSAAEDGETGVKKYGVVHDIAEDRQINRVGGIYEPEGLDRYLKRKFDALFEKIGGMESRLQKMETGISEVQQSLERLADEKGKKSGSGGGGSDFSGGKSRAELVR